jgi:flagellar biosynthesis protein FlhF
MTTRVFRGRSLLDARRAATAALGDDAVVLTTRQVKRSGLFGLFGATEVEIAAAALPINPAPPPAPKGPFAAGAYATDASRMPARESASKAAVVNALRADLRSEMRAVKLAMTRPPSSSNLETSELAAEVSAMRDVLEQYAPPASRATKLTALLRARGIEGNAASSLAKALRGSADGAPEARLREELARAIQIAPWALPTRGGRVLVAAVGPSGVGKTTTLAKLATLARAGGHSVALVTCDTFRVGGVEQVRRYATLLDVPFEAVHNADELETFLRRTTANFVVLDTSGRVPRAKTAEMLLAESAFAERDACTRFERNVLLCMPAACRDVDARAIVKSFSVTSPTALAVTKLDETSQPSGIVHAVWASKLPIALTCSGQRVPEDLEPADLPSLLEQLVPTSKYRKAKAA